MIPQLSEPESIGTIFSRLKDDAEHLVRAELALAQARIAQLAADLRLGVILAVVAIILVHAAIIALVVGIVVALANAIGPVLGIVAGVGGTLVVAAILGWVAITEFKKAFAPTVVGSGVSS